MIAQLIMPLSPLFEAVLKSSPAKRMLVGGGLGLLGSQVENQTLLKDYDPSLKAINSTLGTATGGIAGLAGLKHPGVALSTLASWPIKQLGILGVGTGKKYVDIQQPIAEKNLETARTTLETARIQSEQAKHMSPSDLAQLGLAGAGLAGAGGLGYYLYNSMGPGKKKTAPKVTVTLDGKNKGQTQVEGDMDTLELSKQLHQALRRDTKRKLREEARHGVRHETQHPHAQEPKHDEAPAEAPRPIHGIVRDDPNPSTMANIVNLLRN